MVPIATGADTGGSDLPPGSPPADMNQGPSTGVIWCQGRNAEMQTCRLRRKTVTRGLLDHI